MSDGTGNPWSAALGAGWSASQARRWILTAVVLGLVVYAYGISRVCLFQVTRVSLIEWLMLFWQRGGDYAHGYLVPVVAGGVFWWKWRTVLRQVPVEPAAAGLIVIGLAMVIYVIGVRGQVPRVVAGSLIVLIYGIVFYLGGWRWAKESWFPCLFLVFMIPVNFLDQYVAFPLRMIVTNVSVVLLNLLGLGVEARGTGIHSLTGQFSPLDVADPCSGIRSLVALIALTSVYGYLAMDQSWKKWVLFLSSVPLAIIGNLARITTVALVAQGFGNEAALKIFHDFSGYIVFSLAIICMLGIGGLLNVHWKQLVQHWLDDEEPPPNQSRRR